MVPSSSRRRRSPAPLAVAALLAGALPGLAQETGEGASAPPPVPSEEPLRPLLLNRLELIVNDRCLTRRELDIEVYRAFQRTQGAALTEEGRARLVNDIVGAQIDALLKTQGGKDLGFDEALVRRLVTDHHERREERAGSASRLGDELANFDLDSGTYYEDTESYVLSQLWTGAVQGYYPGPGGRPYVDTFIPPHRLRFEYERGKGLADLETTVTVQEIAIDARLVGDVREAKAVIDDLRARIELGEDFGQVGLEAGALRRDTLGIHADLREQDLTRVPGLDEFLPGAEPGDVSQVLPVRDRETDTLQGFRIVKLVSRERPEPPPFEDPKLQSRLTEDIRRARDQIRVEVALGELREAAYVWPPRLFGRSAPPPPPPERPATDPGEGAFEGP